MKIHIVVCDLLCASALLHMSCMLSHSSEGHYKLLQHATIHLTTARPSLTLELYIAGTVPPAWLADGAWPNLTMLDVSRNALNGTIPPWNATGYARA